MNPSSLPLVVKIVGFIVSWAASIYFLWVRKPPAVLALHPFYGQVQRISIVVISIFLALIFGYFGNSSGLAILAGLAIGATTFGTILFFVVVHRTTNPPKADQPASTGILTAFLLYTTAISCGLTSAGVFLAVILSNPANAATGTALVRPEVYTATVTVNGETDVQENQDSPFSASSGQLNFGCNETASAKAEFILPVGATLVGQPTASWRNEDNAKNATAQTTIQGNNIVIGQGSIRGLNYQTIGPFQNCPGGGHGELVLTGVYRSTSTQRESRRVQVTSMLTAGATDPVWVTLPEIRIHEIGVSFKPQTATTNNPVELIISPTAPNTTENRFQAILENGKLGLVVRK